jgi:hypothetical protein
MAQEKKSIDGRPAVGYAQDQENTDFFIDLATVSPVSVCWGVDTWVFGARKILTRLFVSPTHPKWRDRHTINV